MICPPCPLSRSLRHHFLSNSPHRLLLRVVSSSSSAQLCPRNRVFTSLARRHRPPNCRRSLSASLYRFLLAHPQSSPASFKLADLQQSRGHSGHHHGHGHHHHHHGADPFLLSKDTTDPGVRITRVGLYVNLAMAVTKGVGGWMFNSQALVCFPPLFCWGLAHSPKGAPRESYG